MRRNILITGCSSGIGRHCALTLAKRQDWRVFASARKTEDVEKLQKDGLSDALQLDLDSPTSIHSAMETVLAQTGGCLDALFNNGAYGQPGAVEDLSRDALRAQFESNVFGTQELTNTAIAIMRKDGGGRIIQNSSVLGFVCLKYRGAYNASKYALEALSDTMRLELAGTNIHIALIEPGPIVSAFRQNAATHFHRQIDTDTSAHHDAYVRMQEAWSKGASMPFALEPKAVYKNLLHALNARRPKLRYRVTIPTIAFWYLKRLLPCAWLDNILTRV